MILSKLPNGSNGTQCSHSYSSDGYSYSDNRTPHSLHYSHYHRTGQLTHTTYIFIIQRSRFLFPHFGFRPACPERCAVWRRALRIPLISAQTEPKARMRMRRTVIRIQITEPRRRSRIRNTTEQGSIPSIRVRSWMIEIICYARCR